ncbi:Acetate kinase [hydrothermal vent metagenome]|uniref:Acetate kinase n=1 Tax=hydrothermal vent metagenome TaxID=652676 RepID=A0A3B1D727_9ZZZZ
MKVLVANLGSTSFKYALFDLPAEVQLARGGIDRIGEEESSCQVEIGEHREEITKQIPDHASAVQMCLEQLTHPETGCLISVEEVAGIGFKAVFAGTLSGVRFVDDELLTMMEELADVAPAHNPPYVRAMRELQAAFPNIPLVAALETGFHETIPKSRRTYAIPFEWSEKHHIQRWGFHGASHRFIAQRIAEVLGRDDLKVISCHLGGSASISAIQNGESIANSFGMTPQTGLPHNNRVGDFDPFALPLLMKATGKELPELLDDLSHKGGLLGISGMSGDVRDLEEAASNGNVRAQLAIDVFVEAIRHYIGSFLVALGGVDALVFTGGIGENSETIRRAVCHNMAWAGIELDTEKNKSVKGEASISSENSSAEVWVIPTNEELVVARQTAAIINEK